MLRNTGFWTVSIVRYSRNYKTQRFGNCICFPPQVRGRHLLSWVPLKVLTSITASCVAQFIEYRTIDKAQKPSDSESEPFRIY
jgi:cytochrome c-type biogenesis protein CcmH/NrfF